MPVIQRDYNIFQQIGLVGQLSRCGEPYALDTAEVAAGVTLVPGDGVYLDSSGDWVKPTNAATQKLVTHIVSYDTGVVSTAISSPTTNSLGQIQYTAGNRVKAGRLGTFYVIAGATVRLGVGAIYDQTDGRWNVYAPTAGDLTDFRTAVFEFASSGDDGDIVECRAIGKVQF